MLFFRVHTETSRGFGRMQPPVLLNATSRARSNVGCFAL